MTELRVAVAAATLLCGMSAASAQDVAEAAIARFEACLAAETGDELGSDARDGLAGLAEQLGEHLEPECGDSCGAEIAAMGCDELAELWAAPLGFELPHVDVGDLPEWATAFTGAVTARVRVCFEAETGADPSAEERAAIDAYQVQLAGMLVSLTDSLGCDVADDAVANCVNSVHSVPCRDLASGLFAGAGQLAAESSDACSTMFDCDFGVDDDALDALFEQEIGSEEAGH